MKIKSSPNAYGILAVAFHWTSAVLATGMFASGLWMTNLTYSSPWYHEGPHLHKAFGIMFAALILARLAWKGLDGKPRAIGNAFERKAASLTHVLLYVLLACLFASGYLIATADGRPVELFGLAHIPSLVTARFLEAPAGKVHFFSAWGLAILVVLHAAASLKHHFVNKDEVLVRMLGKSRPNTGKKS